MNLCGCVLVLAVYPISSISSEQDDEYEEFMQNAVREGLHLFTGLDQLKTYFRENVSDPLAKRILDTFERDCIYMKDLDVPPGGERVPFIVIDGNHRPSREIIGKRLSKLLNGRYLVHPAPCLGQFLPLMPRGTLFRRALYFLSVYAHAFNVKVNLNLGRPTILNGYWLDQVVFHVVQSFPRGPLPPASSPIFKQPDDLLPPDLIIYLNIPDSLKVQGMTTRSPLLWKPRVMQLYKDLEPRHNILVHTLSGNYTVSTRQLHRHIQQALGGCRELRPFWRHIQFDYDEQDDLRSNVAL